MGGGRKAGGGIYVPDWIWDWHQGWASTSCTLMQVLNVVPRYPNGKVQLSQPKGVIGFVGGSLVDVQIAVNPFFSNPLLSDLNVTVRLLLLLIKLHEWEIDPQCFEKWSSSNQSFEHVLSLSSSISNCRNVSFILCPSPALSVHV